MKSSRSKSVFRMRKTNLYLPAILVLTMTVASCGESYSFYNPLDPREDAPLEDILPYVVDPDIRAAIQDAAALMDPPVDTKNGIEYVSVFDANVTTLTGLEFFSRLRALELNFVGLVDNDVDLDPLTRLSQLEALNLMNNGFGPETLGRIPHIPSLNYLSLGYNLIEDAAALVDLLSPYKQSQLGLDLQFAELELDTLPALNEVMDRLNSLNLVSIGSVSAGVNLSAFDPNDTLQALTLSDLPGLTDVSGIARFQELYFVDLSNNQDLTEGVEELLDLPRLTEVNVSSSPNVPLQVLDDLEAQGVIVIRP